MWAAPSGRATGLVLRVLGRTAALDGYDRALALACQGFVAVLPTLYVLGTVLPGSDGGALASDLGLSPRLIEAAGGLVAGSAPSTQLTVVGVALLVVSVFGFVRTLQRVYTAAWGLTTVGIRAFGRSVLASATLVAEFTVLVLVAPVLGRLSGSVVIGLAAHAVTALLLWWPIQRVLVSGRVGWRRLLPGALVAGIGQALLVTVSGLYMPIAVARAAHQLGLLGVVTVLLSWLIVLGLLLVLSAVAGAELARDPFSPATDEERRSRSGEGGAHAQVEEEP